MPARESAPTGGTERQISGSPPLLDVRDVAVHYKVGGPLGRKRGIVKAVDGVSLRIERGEILGLVGESGSGKSTLAKALVRLEPATRGEALLDGVDLLNLEEKRLKPMRRRIQMVFQDSLNSLNPRRTVGYAVAEPLLVHNIVPRAQMAGRVGELLSLVGLDPTFAVRRPTQLSGGQRQRVNIARALAPEPELIIADEPTSALDVSVQAQILNLLRELQRTTGVACLFISHDLGVIRRMTSRVAVLYLGRIVETGTREELYNTPRHPYTRALLEVAPHADPRRERQRRKAPIPGEVPSALSPPAGCHFHPRCPMARERCTTDDPPLRELSVGHSSACHYAEELARVAPVGPVLEVDPG